MRTIKDQAVLITGASRGIGKRLAVGFAAAGARVGLLARSQVELDAAQLEIQHAGGTSIPIRADVRSFEQMCGAVERMHESFGGVHVLVAAAAVQGPIGPLVDGPLKAWVEAIEINLIGVMHACRAVLPQMIERRSGKIIVLSGRGAAQPRPYFTSYSASKAGAARLVESLAEEIRDHNIQVNCMAPGGTYTSMTDEIILAGDQAGWKDREDAEEVRLTGGVPPEKQIQLALFLASEQSNHVSGKLIHINDDWKRLERSNVNPGLFTLRRIHKI